MAKCGKAGSAALREYAAECTTTKGNSWSEEEDQTFIQTHREGKTFQEIVAMLPRRTEGAVEHRWMLAKKGKAGTAALTAYAAECIPSGRYSPWSVEEDMTIIRAHKEGKTFKEIAAMLPGRTYDAVNARWQLAKNGKFGTAPLLAYAAAYCKLKRPISREDRASLL